MVGTVTAVKFVLTTATNNDIISIAGDIIIPPIAVYFDIVTEEFGIREVEGIVTPITDDGDFSCYSCTINVFKRLLTSKLLRPISTLPVPLATMVSVPVVPVSVMVS